MSSEVTDVTVEMLRAWPLPALDDDGSKHDRGTVLVVGGSPSTPGAALLTGLAALRVGAGRLQLATDPGSCTALGVAVPEALVVPYDEAAGLRDGAAALVVGPGLTDEGQVTALLEQLLPGVEVPVVVDALALRALRALDPRPATGPLVLTPNDGELLGLVDTDGIDGAAVAAERFGAVVVHQEGVVAPDGRRWRDGAGGVGLGTSGSGDVLAGVVGGLLARGAEATQAAVLGAHLHKVAGDRLTQRHGRVGFLARELLDELPGALSQL